MNEVANSKVSGEEDRYSHTDLWDFDANDDGSIAAFKAIRPLVAARDGELAVTIDRQFAALDAALDAYKTPSGGFRLYTQLTKAQTRARGEGRGRGRLPGQGPSSRRRGLT